MSDTNTPETPGGGMGDDMEEMFLDEAKKDHLASQAERADADDLAALRHEIERLPERYRLALVAVDLEGDDYAAAAARLAVPVGTIRSRLSAAREKLRERLARLDEA